MGQDAFGQADEIGTISRVRRQRHDVCGGVGEGDLLGR